MTTRVNGTSAADFLREYSYDNLILSGRGGNDTLQGSYGNDRVFGGIGNDTIYVSTGRDDLYGGAGNDTYIADSSANGFSVSVHEDAAGGVDTFIIRTSLVWGSTPDNVERVLIEADVLRFEGNDADNVIDASTRYNSMTISGHGGNDRIFGTSDHDIINGGSGADTMSGGAGYDTYYVDNLRDVILESASSSDTDQVYSTVSFTLNQGVEELALLGAARNGTGNAQDNSIYGNGLANVLVGRGGDDRLGGGAANDSIDGGDGDDVLDGGLGRDILTGGGGADVFVFQTRGSGSSRATADVIRDFRSADLIDLTSADANLQQADIQQFTFIGANEFHDRAGELRFSGGYLMADRNGDGAADFFIAVTGSLADVRDSLLL